MTIDEALKKIKPRKTLNKALLLKVAAKLRRLRHEAHYRQSTYFDPTPCGTAACIAGHALLVLGVRPTRKELANPQLGVEHIHDIAQRALGLENKQAGDLFDQDACGWPHPYKQRFRNALWQFTEHGIAPGIERPSRVAADLLEAVAKGKVKLE